MNKSRHLLKTLRNLKESYLGRIIVLTGARQVGKTTLVKNLFSDYVYISFDDPIMRQDLAKLTASQWARAYPRAILDEVQKMPDIFDKIKAIYDLSGEERYILTGSSQILLLHQVKETLAGRCSIYEMYPLTLPEQLTYSWEDSPKPSYLQRLVMGEAIEPMPSFRLEPSFELKLEAYQDFLKFGGFPALIAHKLSSKERYKWLQNYIKTYLERDIRDLADFRKLDPFVDLQRISALQTGQLVNFSSLGRQANIQSATAQKFLQYLSISYQTLMLKPWYRNSLKRLSKMPKIHYLDPGIQRTLTLNQSEKLNGNEFESAIIAEIYKQIKAVDITCHFYHLRTSDDREVDLILELEQGYIAIEIKQSSKISPQDSRHLRHLSEILDKPILYALVLSQDYETKFFEERITAMHAAHVLT
ncbi:MAG: ATP-binding protein [Chitinophagales bacterium]|nr:ATP-binding protein [Chitinophagales bacterium]